MNQKQTISMKGISVLLSLLFACSTLLFSQTGVSINTTGAAADPSAMLDVSSDNAGILIPRMTKTQRNAILAPAEGLLIYQTDDTIGFWYYSNKWNLMGQGGGSGITPGTDIGNTLYWDGSQWNESSNIYNAGGSVGIGTNNPSSSAKFEISSTTGGALIPRMTTAERNAIQNPARGLQIYNLDCDNFEYFNGSSWAAVNPTVVAGISISANPGSFICSGTSVTFTAISVNGGTSPVYQWKINGANVGTNSNTYTTSTLANGDQVSCELTSNAACVSGSPAVSNTIMMAVSIPPTVANAGADINLNSYGVTTATLAANAPTVGTGLWSVISGIAIIINPSSPTSSVIGLVPGAVTLLRWTISNPPCPDSYDDVVITTASCIVGDFKEGGIVFYNSGSSCYVSATSDQSTGAEWGCQGTDIAGAYGKGIGTGVSNTTAIVNNNCSTSGIAARICDDLVLNGYSDWFLPSIDELQVMYNQRSIIGGFTSNYYWSSTMYSDNSTNEYAKTCCAWYFRFCCDFQDWTDKYNTLYVRCIRRY